MDADLQQFLAEIEKQNFFSGLTDAQEAQSKAVLKTFINETVVAYSLVKSNLNHDIKILEVGAGLCLLSLFLKSKGYDVTALEPLAGGFSFFDQLKDNILDFHSDIELQVIDKKAQDISPDVDGKFDLIFSNNVVEHIDELELAFRSMSSILAKDGKMIHGCPNYLVPYEPHFGVPVLCFLPVLTKWLWTKKITQKMDVWDSLNFVTYFRIKRIGKSLGYQTHFRPNLTYNAFERLRQDLEFRSRHKSTVVGVVLRALEFTKTIKLTKHLPVWASTPMIFSMTKAKSKRA